MRRHASTILVGWLCCCATGAWCCAPAAGEEPAAGIDLADLTRWKFEELALTDGRRLQGLVQAEDGTGVTFVEVHQPPGRPMFLIVRPHSLDGIAAIRRLDEADRGATLARIDRFRNRAAVEVGEMAALRLERGRPPKSDQWQYRGEFFLLASTADEELLRRSIVRIEQVYLACQEILPPRTKPASLVQARLFDSLQEYERFQSQFEPGLRMHNAAFYSTRRNVLAAGSDWRAFAAEWARVRARHEKIRAECRQQAAAMPQAIAELLRELESQGVEPAARREAKNAAEGKWRKQLADKEAEIVASERRNAAQFEELTGRMFRRLTHEVFHAYLENYVYPHDRHDVPRWLNEGLAQVFEDGLLEFGSLRLDGPSQQRLAALQADLRGDDWLSLARVLLADEQTFLVWHAGDSKASERIYLYSWGLAYYLASRRPILRSAALDRYVARPASEPDPIARFEKLVGMPLAEFDRKWRDDMLALAVK